MEYFLGLNSETNFNFELFKTFSGVGMVRGENLCIKEMQYFTKEELCNYVTKYLKYIANIFTGKEVWYRTADLVPHQINLLDGCDKVINEEQYLIGLRGVRRNLQFADTYNLELMAFINAYNECHNLGLLIPYISNLEELIQVKQILNAINYNGSLGIMVEIPSIIFMLDEIENLGVDNYTIGVNDLTTNILGVKRDLEIYNINDPAVYKAIEYIVEKVHSFGKKVTLAGYLNREMQKFAENIGVDIINVHYNEIPLLFDTDAPNFFTEYYDNLKANYKEIKRVRIKNG